MSRTTRRKSGNRWFAEKQIVHEQTGVMYYWEDYVYSYNSFSGWDKRPVCWLRWETIQVRSEYDKSLVSKYERDYYVPSWHRSAKTFDNSVRRARQRQQLSKIMQGQEYYDESYEDSKCKGAAWYFD